MRRALVILLLAAPTALSACSATTTGPTASETTAGGHTLGPDDAAVTLVVFGDYGCRPCAVFGRRLRRVVDGHRRTRLVYHHCPSSRHPLGREAALAALAASDRGRFWELHWRLVEEGPVNDEATLRAIALEVGLEPEDLAGALRSEDLAARLRADLELADRLGVRGMPTTFVGGLRLDGAVSEGALEEAIARAEGGDAP